MATRQIYTIPPGADFLKSLVRGLKAQFSADDLSRALILLPTRRACQHLCEAFLSEAGGSDLALLLPDIRPLGDVEEEELMLSAGAEFLRKVAEVSRAVDPMRRQMLLAQLVERMHVPSLSKAQAFLLASDLARLIDDALIEGCGFENLASLVPEKYAAHWKQIIEFLKIVHDYWPKILQDEQAIDAVDRRQRLQRLLIEHWQAHPPAHHVIAAGSTGSQPITAELLKTISRLPQGVVILPGLDQHLEEEAWNLLEPSHPQYYLARLLRTLECERDQVRPWPQTADHAARVVLLSEAMRPTEATDRWRHLKAEEIPSEAWRGLEIIEAAHEHQEALVAALMLRKIAEEPEKTVALVTPDRALAKRVGALMRRWNIELDDSAGFPLFESPVGSYLNLLLDLPDDNLRPSQLMGFFKHPFSGCGLAREDLLRRARKLEMEFFRDRPRGRGLKTWLGLLQSNSKFQDSAQLLEKFSTTLAPLAKTEERPFTDWLQNLREVAERLAAESSLLWREAEGEALAQLVESFSTSARELIYSYSDFAEIFRQGLRDKVVRRPWGQHPRLAILGLLEARLLRFDQVILGGLNEGSWPRLIEADPWMSPAMRVDLGCADVEVRIGQMAHDFVQQAASGNVALLRARRQGETPTIPSRWLLRLNAVRELVGVSLPPSPWITWAEAVDFCAELEPCAPPAVKVPHHALPAKLYASDIERWLRDPYAFYASRILNLSALGALDAEFSVRERGILIHGVLKELTQKYGKDWPPRAEKDFVDYIKKGLAGYGCTPEACELLSARLSDLAREYWLFEQARRQEVTEQFSECRGALPMQVSGYSFSLEARADRIDVLKAGGISILDYKTTALPRKAEREAGLWPQLYVEAVIAEGAGFKDVPKASVSEIAYVAFDQNQGEVYLEALSLPPEASQKIHRPALENFIRAFLQKNAAYHAVPRPQLLPPSPDYARLARVAEWSKGAVAQDEGEA